MTVRFSPDATRWTTGAGALDPDGADGAVGSTRMRCPTTIRFGLTIPFKRIRSATLTPSSTAIWLRVSPRRTTTTRSVAAVGTTSAAPPMMAASTAMERSHRWRRRSMMASPRYVTGQAKGGRPQSLPHPRYDAERVNVREKGGLGYLGTIWGHAPRGRARRSSVAMLYSAPFDRPVHPGRADGRSHPPPSLIRESSVPAAIGGAIPEPKAGGGKNRRSYTLLPPPLK